VRVERQRAPIKDNIQKTNDMSKFGLITRGLIKENPTFVLVLGMCPTIGTTTSAINGMGMGLATMAVLILSNMAIAAVAPYIPDKVRIPCYIVIIAAFVTAVQFIMQAYTPALYETLGIFIPLIVVNCIVLGRAEAFANKHTVIESAYDGLGIGLGFVLSLTVIGFVRELFGGLSIFGNKISSSDGMLAFVLAPGGFLVLGYLMVLFNKLKAKNQ
jgi:Na+-translocating ferredoxin:NAD+ oxidoreductase subunit E